jgi:hypothetical protein
MGHSGEKRANDLGEIVSTDADADLESRGY